MDGAYYDRVFAWADQSRVPVDLPEDVKCAITGCRACEDGEIAKGVLDKIVENYEIADAQNVPICQDTGMACVFLEIGQDVHIAGGDLAGPAR